MNDKKEYIEREATCKDCVHYDICLFHVDEESRKEKCVHFKNKADVVEVQHAKWIPYEQPLGVGYSIANYKPTHYCSHCKGLGWEFYTTCPHCSAVMDGKDEEVMSQKSNEELNKWTKQYSSTLQEILTPEDDGSYDREKYSEGGVYGWICPKCGAIMSPYQKFCVKCSGDFELFWTANPNTTGTNYTIPSSSECRANTDKSRCHKCVYEMTYLQNKDIEGKCPDYKRDAPDGRYYG